MAEMVHEGGAVAPPAVREALDELAVRRLERTLLELRQRGLSYPAIATVLDLYEGIDLDPEAVRWWLRRLGAPVSEAKARAAREVNRRRAAA